MKSTDHPGIDLAAVRRRLAESHGPRLWRSLEQLAGTGEFRQYLENEFAPGASEWKDPLGRRELLKLLGSTLGLAGLTACTREPVEKIVPYVRAPEELIPGRPLYFATALPGWGAALPVLVESHMGRPTKVEGNPDHPASGGATDVFAQASVLTLYDPDRSQVVIREGRISSWVAFQAAAGAWREDHLSRQGEGLRVLTEPVVSPTLAAQLRDLLARFPLARWHQYEPVSRGAAAAGARLAFGEPVHSAYRLAAADVIVSLDADFLNAGPGAVHYAREFSRRRRPDAAMNRLYVVEPAPSVTGASADHRLPLSSAAIEAFAQSLAAAVGVAGAASTLVAPGNWVRAVAADLAAHRGSSLVIAGEHQPASVHALAHAINATLGNAGRTVVYTQPLEAEPADGVASIKELAADMKAGKVATLLMLGGNPVYDAPVDLDFAGALGQVLRRVHLSLYEDETSRLCHWHVPEAHPLESWSDTRSYDGTVTIVQPLIAPLYGGKSAHEMIAVWTSPDRSGHDLVRDYWKPRAGAPDFDQWWQRALHDGIVAGTAFPTKPVALRKDFAAASSAPPPAGGIELSFRPDPTIWDGRWANNGWLQELPKPLTKLTWDNAVMLSPRTAERLDIHNEDVVVVRHGGRSVRGPAWILPGHADDAATVHLGYGRRRAGRIGSGIGFDAGRLRTSETMWRAAGVEIRKTAARQKLAITQEHHGMEGRDLVRVATLDQFRKDPHFSAKAGHAPKKELSLYPEHKYEGYSWGMAIDLNACTGCGACTIACQAENNIPIVGRREVARGREMHWIRVDRYFEGGVDNPGILYQPVACMHCENAPCEVVCPVAATAHSEDGLNQMVYNRCVGTRYCANNCPYKVRRFNFFLYSNWTSASLEPLRNPDVTVRSRGVMEKCTYCVQRINAARIDAEKQDRRIRDGEVVTACQAVCPSEAIVFGDLNDPQSRVVKVKKDVRDYTLLTELATKPRTSYLARLRNPNPALES